MNTDQKISPQRRGDAECGTKEMAGEAIGHLVWDALASRPSLIGLMEPTTTPADYKGLFLTTEETGMNTDQNIWPRENAKSAKTSLQEAGEVLVEGAGDMSEKTPAKRFCPRYRAKEVLARPTCPDCITFDVKNTRQNGFNEFRGRDTFSVNIVVCPDEKEVTGGVLEKNGIESGVGPSCDLTTSLGVVCDAFDGFFHGGSVAKQFAEKFVSAACAHFGQIDSPLRNDAWLICKHPRLVQANHRLVVKFDGCGDFRYVEFRGIDVECKQCEDSVVEFVHIKFASRQRLILRSKCGAGIPSFDDNFGRRVLLVIDGADSVLQTASCAFDVGRGLPLILRRIYELCRTAAEGTREQVWLFHERRMA